MTRIERGICLSEKDIQPDVKERKISRVDVVKRFGFDYEEVVVERLKYWNNLPAGHRLSFFDIAESHQGSSGLYLLEEIVGDSWVFVQAMFENGVSTKHMHKERVIELYDPLAGESFLTVNGKEHRLNAGIPLEVFPRQIHQLKTRKNPSLNLLVMKNSAHIPRNKLHIPVV